VTKRILLSDGWLLRKLNKRDQNKHLHRNNKVPALIQSTILVVLYVSQKEDVSQKYEFREILDRYPCPYQQEGHELDHIDSKKERIVYSIWVRPVE